MKKLGNLRLRDIAEGAQYLSSAYITTLQEHSIKISVAQHGCPWENGYAERLIRTLKEEEVDINDYQSITKARDHIGHSSHKCITKNAAFGIRAFDTCRISTTKLVLTLRNFGHNKRWHFSIHQ